MDPIYRIRRGDPAAEPVRRIERPRLLTPAEREQAKQQREKKRRQNAPQDPRGGVDHSA